MPDFCSYHNHYPLQNSCTMASLRFDGTRIPSAIPPNTDRICVVLVPPLCMKYQNDLWSIYTEHEIFIAVDNLVESALILFIINNEACLGN